MKMGAIFLSTLTLTFCPFGCLDSCLIHNEMLFKQLFDPVESSGTVVGFSLAAGMVLAVIGAAYPALLAARMKPVDALRVDE